MAFSRAAEAEDEELLYAYAATNTSDVIQKENLPVYLREYMGRTLPLYTEKNFQKGMSLAVRAIGAEKMKWLPSTITTLALGLFKIKAAKYNRDRARLLKLARKTQIKAELQSLSQVSDRLA